MIHTVVRTKPNSFMSEGGLPNKYKNDENGRPLPIGKYKSNTIPGTFVRRRVKWSTGKRKWLIDIDQAELNSIVEESMVFNPKTQEQIKTANLNNEYDPFFTHPETFFLIEGGSNLVDDSTPLGKFWLKWMRSNKGFTNKGDTVNPAMAGIIEYTISTPAKDVAIAGREVDVSAEAVEIFINMSFADRCSILQAMGVVLKDPDPEAVKVALFTKITDEKNLTSFGAKETNLVTFMKLAKASKTEINLRGKVSKAKEYGIISKGKKGIFTYGEVVLGRSLDEVCKFLEDGDNFDVLNRIDEALTQKGA